jgi:hypothetical protein
VLIIAKIIWIQTYKSEMQIQDIENLLMHPDKDMNYIKKWCLDQELETYNLLPDE